MDEKMALPSEERAMRRRAAVRALSIGLVLAGLLLGGSDAGRAGEQIETSASWRFWDLHFAPKPPPLERPAAAEAVAPLCGDIDTADWQCARAQIEESCRREPRLDKAFCADRRQSELALYRQELVLRRETLRRRVARIKAYPDTFLPTDLQLAVTASGLSAKQASPDLVRAIADARFVLSMRGHLRRQAPMPRFPY